MVFISSKVLLTFFELVGLSDGGGESDRRQSESEECGDLHFGYGGLIPRMPLESILWCGLSIHRMV
jgi:hypothetical protein